MSKQAKMLLLALSIAVVMAPGFSYAQQNISVRGSVLDVKDGAPLAGATVQRTNGRGTAVADENGRFEISLPEGGRVTVSMTGYISKTVSLTDTEATITLEASDDGMDEVVVIGYTAQKKELLSGSVAQIKIQQSDLELPTTSAGNLLAGKMAGVAVSTPNGMPGAQPAISIRTSSSWNAAPVLYVIDGKISGSGDFNNLSPNEIAEITVLKDAATTAAYGSRAAGGVMLITTKRGSASKATISYSVNTGYDKRGKNMDLTSALEWGEVHARIWGMGVGGPAGAPWTETAAEYFRTHDFGGGYGYGFNLLNDVYRDPLTTTHNLSASGGTDKIQYFIGGSLVDQQSFIKNTDFTKYNIRANITANLNRDFTVFAGLSVNNNKVSGPTGDLAGDTYQKLLIWQPYMPSFTSNGLPVDYFWISNKSGEADGLAGYNRSQTIKPVINLSLTYKAPFLEGLSAKASYMKSYTNYQNKIFTHPFQYYQLHQTEPIIWDLDSIVGSRLTAHTPSLEKRSDWSTDDQLNLQLSYNRSFGDHNVNAAMVYERFEAGGEGMRGIINGFPLYTTDQWWASTSTGIINNSPTKFIDNNYGSGYLTGRKSWIGQFLYDYAGKYIANFTYRYDGSMNFAPDKRWGFFPSGSVGWIVSKEGFFSGVKGIDMLKLRASVGLTGNDVVGGWQWQDSYQGGSSAFFGTQPALNQGIQYNVLPNMNITWEKYLNKNIGIDINFLRDFSATLEYWHTYTYDILGARIQTTPPTFSRPLPAVNYGKQKAHGVDFSINYNKLIRQVSFSAGAVASYGYSWYTQRDQNVTYDYQNMVGDGRATSMITGYQVDHMLRTQADLDAWVAAHPDYRFNGYAPEVGQFVYKDWAGPDGVGKPDGIVNAHDIAVLRKRNNPVVMGLNLGAEWKGLSIQANFNGSLGYQRSFNDVAQGVEWNRMWRGWYNDAWTLETPNTWLPKRYSVNDNIRTTNVSGSDFWLADASFLRLKFLNVAYVIPQNLYNRYISSIRVYVSGANLFTISKFNKTFYDPEMGSGLAFPIIKSYNAGVSVTF